MAETDPQTSKLSAQVKKLAEANGKYKNLLKLAKERIQAQEDEIQKLKHLEESNAAAKPEEAPAIDAAFTEDAYTMVISSVKQRIKVPGANGHDEIWALFEWEALANENYEGPPTTSKKSREWKKFDTESELQDYIRRDTGEPLILPPFSLSPEQSAQVQKETMAKVAQITEEFRRFRVKAELARKQTETQIRDLQSSQLKSATQRRDHNSTITSTIARSDEGLAQVERLRAEMAAQEAQWKESYNLLLSENNALKSAGSEALLASQWRHRYEQCVKERDELKTRVRQKTNNIGSIGGGSDERYEQKYKELKESFKLYRKKAKEIFEEQQRGEMSNGVVGMAENSSAESKLSYVKNLMVNYFTADPTVREHMEGAIATVLQFTPDDVDKIEQKKVQSESWF